MDRLGRNEFIGEVRVALKKLKEGENKRYNMGLERIAQVRAGLAGVLWRGCRDTPLLFCFDLIPFACGLPSVCFQGVPQAAIFTWRR